MGKFEDIPFNETALVSPSPTSYKYVSLINCVSFLTVLKAIATNETPRRGQYYNFLQLDELFENNSEVPNSVKV